MILRMDNHFLERASILLVFPSLFGLPAPPPRFPPAPPPRPPPSLFLPPLKRPSFLPPSPNIFSLLSFVFCFALFPFPPNPYLLSRVFRLTFGFDLLDGCAPPGGGGEPPSSTAMSKLSFWSSIAPCSVSHQYFIKLCR